MFPRFLLATFTGFLLSFAASAQINVQWVGRYTTAGNNIDRAKAMQVDASGNSYVVGTSWNGSNFDITTAKFDPNGVLAWATPYNGTGNGYDEARAIDIDASGNVYVTGYSAGPSNNYDIVTIKYNAAGAQQWATQFNGTANGFDEGYDIAVDGSGNVYVTGGTVSTTSNANYITIKYNAAGVQQWATTYSNTTNSTASEVAYALTLDASGNIYVTGTSYANATNDHDIATVKYNNSGTQQWVARYNGPGSVFDAGADLVVDAALNVYVTGYARDLVGTTNYSYATIKYNAAGSQQWASIYDGPAADDDEARAICLTPAGNVAVTGRSLGTGSTAEDCTTILYNGSNGSTIWARRFDGGAVQYDEGIAVAADSSNRIFVTGYSYAIGTNNNFLTIRYEANGDTSWIVKYNGPGNNADQAYSLAIGMTGEFYVGGMSKGSGTNEDYAVVKYCQLTASAPADTSICLGASVQLSANSSYGTIDSVWWTPSTGLDFDNIANPIASPVTTTSYVLHLRNQYGCIDLDTVVVNIYPLPGPAITSSGPTSFCAGGSVTLTAQDTNSVSASYSWSTGDTTQSITVSASGTYSVNILNNNACASQSTMSVTVNPLPSIAAGNDTSFCTSTSIQLCATGGVSYAWTPSFGVSDTTIACPMFGPTSTTTYTVYGTDANGCTSSDTLTVSLYPLPSIPVITQNIAVLTSTAASGYQWYFNGNPIAGATGQSYTPTQNGNYYVVTTDVNGCSAFSSTYVMNDVGFADTAGDGNFTVYPNPNNGRFAVIYSEAIHNGNLSILTIEGKTVYSQTVETGGSTTADLKLDLAPGVYLVKLVEENGAVSTRRFIIE
jgi:uncharacterized delta-60 repeat protein